MNCKPGTVGRINRMCRRHENLGIYLEVLRPYVIGEVLPGHLAAYNTQGEFGWVVQAIGDEFLTPDGKSKFHVARDEAITPFKDSPGNESWFKSAPLERAKPAEVEA